MKLEKPLWVTSCPYCRIFSNLEVNDRLIWPRTKEEIKNSEFVIVKCETYDIPLVIYRDHVSSVSSEPWGRILFRCRDLFGNNIKLKLKPRKIIDHFSCYVNI